MSPRMAATIAAPALHTMHAAPGRVLKYLHEVIGWMTLQVLAVVDELRQLVRLDVMQGIGESHFSEAMMMAVTLPVGRDVNHLGPGSPIGEAAQKPVGETPSVVQQALKCNRLRNRPVIKEEVDALARRQPAEV